MKAPNKYITIIFILTVTYGVYNLITPSSKKSWDSKPDEAIKLSIGALALGGTVRGKHGSEKGMDKKEERKILPWGKDPFIFPEGMDPYKKESIKKAATIPVEKRKRVIKRTEKPLSVKITSILISEDQKVATIDRAPYIVTIGDWIENEQVMEIMPDRVIFGRNGSRQEILLKSRVKASKKNRGKK